MGPEERQSGLPGIPRHGNLLARPLGAGLLTLVAVALVGAIVVVSGLLTAPADSPARTCDPADSAAPSCSPTPSAAPSPATSRAPSPSFVRPTPTPSPTFTSRVVQPGDTLTSIARTYRTSPRSIAWWNRGTYPSLDPESAGYLPNHIEPGWRLVMIPGVIVDDADHPSPSPGVPTVDPTAAPEATLAGGATSAPAIVVSHGPRGTTRIALTFDMGGRLDPAIDIVQWLIDHEVHATLFPTGAMGTTTATGRTALLLAATRPDLFALGNHSWDHPDFTTLTDAQMADQLTSAETAIEGLIGMTTKPFFRPPFGAWTAAVRTGVGVAGWHDMLMWDIDTIDWKATTDGGPTADGIVTKVLAKAQGGSIVLMHLGGWHTLEALPGILAGLQSRGLTPVTLTTLLGS